MFQAMILQGQTWSISTVRTRCLYISISESNYCSVDDENVPLPYKIELRPASDYKYGNALQKLIATPAIQNAQGFRFLVPGEEEQWNQDRRHDETGLTDERGRALLVSSHVNLQSKISIGCAGAIVTYLQRRKASEFLQGDHSAEEAYHILRLECFSFKDTM